MKKTLLTIFFLLGFSFISNAEVGLKIKLLSKKDSAIKLLITASNTSEINTLLFYKPTEKSFCMSLIDIFFIGRQTGKRHEYDKCKVIYDIDQITLDIKNSILILPGESFQIEIKINLKDISPSLENAEYFIETNLSYEYGNFVSESEYKIFKGFAKSNRILINNKK